MREPSHQIGVFDQSLFGSEELLLQILRGVRRQRLFVKQHRCDSLLRRIIRRQGFLYILRINDLLADIRPQLFPRGVQRAVHDHHIRNGRFKIRFIIPQPLNGQHRPLNTRPIQRAQHRIGGLGQRQIHIVGALVQVQRADLPADIVFAIVVGGTQLHLAFGKDAVHIHLAVVQLVHI